MNAQKMATQSFGVPLKLMKMETMKKSGAIVQMIAQMKEEVCYFITQNPNLFSLVLWYPWATWKNIFVLVKNWDTTSLSKFM